MSKQPAGAAPGKPDEAGPPKDQVPPKSAAEVEAAQLVLEREKSREEAKVIATEAEIRADERRKVRRRIQTMLDVVAPHVGARYFQAAGFLLAKDEEADALKEDVEKHSASPPVVFSESGNLSVAGFVASIVKAACGGHLIAVPNLPLRRLQGWKIADDEPKRAKNYNDKSAT